MRDTVKPFLPRRIPGERIAEPPQELSALRRLAFWRGFAVHVASPSSKAMVNHIGAVAR